MVAQQQEFCHLLDEAQGMRMNAVIVQVRPTADAFYPSSYGPWSQYLTGVQGKNPGYDPLAFMITEAHKRGLEFHAWFNPYRVSMQDDIRQLTSNHPARQHPDWLIHYGGKLYYNPGIPAVREFIVNSVLEVVQRYPIDAVHLDDYFYPYPVASQPIPDEATYQRYGAATFSNRADWRRDNINRLIEELSTRIKALKPHVRLGISPFGVWRNQSVDPAGSATHASVSDYDDLYADTHTWIKYNWIDYIAPQIYWSIGFPPAAYEQLVGWWAKEVAGSYVQLYIGQAAYRVRAWRDPDELLRQLQLNQQYPAIGGSIFFSLKDMLNLPQNLKGPLNHFLQR